MMNNDSKNIIKLLREGDNSTLQKIYIDNRENFIKFAKKYNVERYRAVDIYQDSIIILRKNAMNGRINNLKSSISTYLFAIGKYKIFQNHRNLSKLKIDNEIELEEEKSFINVNLTETKLTNQQQLLKKYLPKLGKRCKDILTLYYYEGFTLDEIVDILGYSDKKVLKSQKSRCLKQIKEMVNKKL